MALIFYVLMEIMRKPTIGGVFLELAALAAPLWLAVPVGLLVGWACRPRWADGMLREAPLPDASSPSNEPPIPGPRTDMVSPSAEGLAVGSADLLHLRRLVEEKDYGLSWISMMEKTVPTMRYQAWRRDPQNLCGLLHPRMARHSTASSTIFEDTSPKVVRDFIWDDEFRMKNRWGDMLLQYETLEECTSTGTLVVQWVRKRQGVHYRPQNMGIRKDLLLHNKGCTLSLCSEVQQTPFCRRPGFRTVGAWCVVKANHFLAELPNKEH